MSVKILYFAGLKEALGLPGETVELPAGVSTVQVTGYTAFDAYPGHCFFY